MAKSVTGVFSSGGLAIGLIFILIGFGAILTTQQSSSSSISGSENEIVYFCDISLCPFFFNKNVLLNAEPQRS